MQNKQLKLKDWTVVSSELMSSLSTCNLSYKALAEAANIGYDAARRYKLQSPKNLTKNAEKLCAFYNISMYETAKMQILSKTDLLSAVNESWDGTQAHAELIIELIKSTKPFEIRNKK